MSVFVQLEGKLWARVDAWTPYSLLLLNQNPKAVQEKVQKQDPSFGVFFQDNLQLFVWQGNIQ